MQVVALQAKQQHGRGDTFIKVNTIPSSYQETTRTGQNGRKFNKTDRYLSSKNPLPGEERLYLRRGKAFEELDAKDLRTI